MGAFRVLVLYSQDTDEHKDWVGTFTSRLTGDAQLFVASLPVEWLLEDNWGEALSRAAQGNVDCLISICTPAYKGRLDELARKSRPAEDALRRFGSDRHRAANVLRWGSPGDSIPELLLASPAFDFENDAAFDDGFKQLEDYLRESSERARIVLDIERQEESGRDVTRIFRMEDLASASELHEKARPADLDTLDALLEARKKARSGERTRLVQRLEGAASEEAPMAVPEPPSPAPSVEQAITGDPKAIEVRIFYATDRARSGKSAPRDFYANERAGPNEANPVTFGSCVVSIPLSDKHRLGGLEKPSLLKFEFSEDPVKHVILKSVSPSARDELFSSIRNRVAQSERKEAFVFVHGYNVGFQDAARRTAQIAYDLAFEGAPILFSWPSRARWWLYPADETLVEWSVPHLEEFLKDVATRSGARTVHLIAHSMGNRCLTKALELLVAKRTVPTPLFRHIILTAPDIDTETFLHLAKAIVPAGDRFTFYANYKDRALLLSKLFHSYRRAGASIVIVKGIDTIDASNVDTSLTKHSYFGSTRTVLADLAALLVHGTAPEKRFGMRQMNKAEGVYYRFTP